MSNHFTLDSIRASAEKKYASTTIVLDDETTVELVNPLRLSKGKRKQLMSIQDQLGEKDGEDAVDVDQEAVFSDAIRLVSKTPAQAEALLDQVGNDLVYLVEIFSRYTESTSAGEASASES